MKLLTVLAATGIMLAVPALAKDCRIPDPKPGTPIQVPPECKDAVRSKQQNDALRSDQGMIDLGNGTTVRIGGRARAEMAVRP